MRLTRTLPLTAVLAVAACGTASSTPSATTSTVVVMASPTAPADTPTEAPLTEAPPSETVTSEAASPTSTTAPGSTPTQAAGRCSALVSSLTPEQKVGQLLMVGIDRAETPSGDTVHTTSRHVGNALYLGGWSSSEQVIAMSRHVQSLATKDATGGIGMLVAADQEGGEVQQIKSVTPLESAVEQSQHSQQWITEQAKAVGGELKGLGINLDLAPVADTVPADIGRSNGPIGHWERQYGNDPQTSTKGVVAFTQGLKAAGVGATVKHFPGLGRISGNTDNVADGPAIIDSTTTADDSFLEPFAAGMKEGAMVMVSSARYPKIDPDNQAVFSRSVITDLLRGRLGHQGVVITDDMGHAKAVAGVPAGQRATRFVAAGGDIVLTGNPADAAPMAAALLAKAKADPQFAQQVDAAANRVVDYKASLGLADCG